MNFFEQKIVSLTDLPNCIAVVTVIEEPDGKNAYVRYYENGNEISEVNNFIRSVLPKVVDTVDKMGANLHSY